MTKIAGAGSASGSINQRHESPDPDPHQNVMEPDHWFFVSMRVLGIRRVIHIPNFSGQLFRNSSEKCLDVDVNRFELQNHSSQCPCMCLIAKRCKLVKKMKRFFEWFGNQKKDKNVALESYHL
jgi:hypothetical protein